MCIRDRYTPGEWIAVHGQNLTADSRIVIGGRAVQVAGFLEGGALLTRLPRGVPPGPQMVQIDNGMGTAQTSISTAVYAFRCV